nr:MAG: polyprotein [Leveillula taurica associated noda-like virus 1]
MERLITAAVTGGLANGAVVAYMLYRENVRARAHQELVAQLTERMALLDEMRNLNALGQVPETDLEMVDARASMPAAEEPSFHVEESAMVIDEVINTPSSSSDVAIAETVEPVVDVPLPAVDPASDVASVGYIQSIMASGNALAAMPVGAWRRVTTPVIAVLGGPYRVSLALVRVSVRRLVIFWKWSYQRPRFVTWTLLGGYIVFRLHRSLKYRSEWYARLCARTWNTVTTGAMSKLVVPYNASTRKELKDKLYKNLVSALKTRQPPAHSHPNAAEQRTRAKRVMGQAIVAAGRDVYEVSGSAHESTVDGIRQYHTAKDFLLPIKQDPIRDCHIIRMVDVDYYADMHHYIMQGKPIMMYTFQPLRVAGSELDYAWRFTTDNTVKVDVQGGAKYEHRVWNWCVDHVVVDEWHGSMVADVETLWVDPDVESRRIVLITPRTYIRTAFAWLYPGRRLERINPCIDGKTLRIDHLTPQSQIMSSIGMPNGVAVNIGLPDLEGLVNRYEIKKLDMGAVERVLSKYAPSDPRIPADASALNTYLSVKGGSNDMVLHKFVAGQPGTTYQTLSPLVTEEGKGFSRCITEPLTVDPPGVPVESFNNDTATIAGRITKVRNEVIPHTRYNMYMAEFLQLLIPPYLVGRGAPITLEEVASRQTDPRQRERYEKYERYPVTTQFKVESFMKHESYPTVNDPRNISSIPIDHNLRLSTYTLALSDDLLKCKHMEEPLPWYMPGSGPKLISTRLQDFAQRYPSLLAVDYSRLDGTISSWLRDFEEAVYLRYFKDDSNELRQLMRAERNAKAMTKHGVRYKPGHSRLSGSPLTTDGNTLICAFVAFCISRESGAVASHAFYNLGLIYGDDGILPPYEPSVAERVASDFGLSLKVDVIKQGEPCKFLGRLFVNPWNSENSIQDPSRCIPRLHLTMSTETNVPIAVAARYRAEAFLVTDRNTPVISNWCNYVLRQYPQEVDYDKYLRFLNHDRPYHANTSDTWPQPDEGDDTIVSLMAADLNVYPEDIIDACEQLDGYPATPWPVLNVRTAIKVDAVVGGEMRHAGDSIYTVPKQTFATTITTTTDTQQSKPSTTDIAQHVPARQPTRWAQRSASDSGALHTVQPGFRNWPPVRAASQCSTWSYERPAGPAIDYIAGPPRAPEPHSTTRAPAATITTTSTNRTLSRRQRRAAASVGNRSR